jgi:hypothetical protein
VQLYVSVVLSSVVQIVEKNYVGARVPQSRI